jgi:xanthine dehydrogenase accessory factor
MAIPHRTTRTEDNDHAMENLDVMVLRTLRDWRQAGKRALLTTVVRTWGSSPRPVGSIMALAEDGAVVGSVSGGCIEDDLIARYSHAHGNGEEVPLGTPPALVKYGITADEAHRFGLPCGGTLELLLEYDPDAARSTPGGRARKRPAHAAHRDARRPAR